MTDPDAAQDAVQEAFIAAYLDLSQLRHPQAFPAWFKWVLYKQCDRLTRGVNILTVPLSEAEGVGSKELGPEELAAERDVAQRLREEITRLPDGERGATELFYIRCCSQQEIAERLGLTVATVKNRLRNSRKYLKERMLRMADEALVQEQGTFTLSEMVPLLIVYDVRRSIEFYRDKLGFEVEGQFEAKGGLGWAGLRRGSIKLMLNSALEPGVEDPQEDKSRSKDVTFYLGSEEVVKVRDHFIEQGLDVDDLHET